MNIKADDYRGKPVNCRQGQAFRAWGRRGYLSVDVLPFLNGKPWDDVALGFVHSLRPTHVRVTKDGYQCDSQTWRVTVFLRADDKTIRKIEQEVEVGLPDKCPHGSGLQSALQYGINSPQVEWENIDGMECFDGVSKPPRSYKIDDAGKIHEWPKPRKTR